MDGVLLDTERLAADIYMKAAAESGWIIGEDFFLKTIGLSSRKTDEVLRGSFGVEYPLAAVKERYREMYRRKIREEGVPVKPGARHILERLHEEGIPLGLASSSRRETIMYHLDLAGMISFFKAATGGDEIEAGKPAPDIFLETARRLGCAAAECAVIEDSPAGLQGAKSAGMITVMVPDLVKPDAGRTSAADFVCTDLYLAERLLFRLADSFGKR